MIVLCDTEIHHQYPYKGITQKEVEGGGGASFETPIAFANTYKPDVLLYFTDGYAHVPITKKSSTYHMGNQFRWIRSQTLGRSLRPKG